MCVMIELDRNEYKERIKDIEGQLIETILSSASEEYNTDNNDVMLEVSSGAGGQEAMLFTREMYNMYRNYIQYRGWQARTVKVDESDIGGMRAGSVEISGSGVYKSLRHEAGVHRVQRVPKTEKSGRLHTSTMAVTVIPKPNQIQVTLNNKDIRMDTFRSTGPGGQSVNKTDSAVRLTHHPTGIVVECQIERSQVENRKLALDMLRTRIFEQERERRDKFLYYSRKTQVGSVGRAEKVRTYNYHQDRITDHRTGHTLHNMTEFLSGGQLLDSMLSNVRHLHQNQVILALCEEHLGRSSGATPSSAS